MKFAVERIFREAGAVTFEDEDEPAQAALTEIYNICTNISPELDPDYEED